MVVYVHGVQSDEGIHTLSHDDQVISMSTYSSIVISSPLGFFVKMSCHNPLLCFDVYLFSIVILLLRKDILARSSWGIKGSTRLTAPGYSALPMASGGRGSNIMSTVNSREGEYMCKPHLLLLPCRLLSLLHSPAHKTVLHTFSVGCPLPLTVKVTSHKHTHRINGSGQFCHWHSTLRILGCR